MAAVCPSESVGLLPRAQLLCELHGTLGRRSKGGEHRRTLGLAPDGSCVAWATGRTTVRIVPWKQLCGAQGLVSSLASSSLFPERLIDCGEPVLSLALGSRGTPSGRKAWTRQNTGICCGKEDGWVAAKSLGGQGCWATREKWDIGLSREAGESQKNGDVWTSGSLSGVGEPGNRWRRFRFGGDNLLLATGLASGRLQIWDVGTGQFLLYLMDHSAAILHLTFSPDDLLTLVSASQDRTLRVWDMGDDGNMVKVLKGHPGWVRCSAFSPDSSLLCSVGNGKSAFLWTVKSWHLKAKLDAHHHDVVSCDFSPDGAILATASFDSTVCLWEPHSVTLLNKLRHLLPPPSPIFAGGANDHWVKAVAFSPDGMHLATLADDR
uniref:WD repeat and SOCS box containing 1 n=1 Tax=Eptatretus burgeri TaxID=7764 RepID=A0A8C4QHC5_EPTBU